MRGFLKNVAFWCIVHSAWCMVHGAWCIKAPDNGTSSARLCLPQPMCLYAKTVDQNGVEG